MRGADWQDPDADPERRIIVHYHIFKNAGTSIDKALEGYFGAGLVKKDQHAGIDPQSLAREIETNPALTAYSSHTTLLPVPKLRGVSLFPIIFVRHPIRRARSVYQFERQQQIDTEGSLAARSMSFSDFIKWRLSRPRDRALRDFQSDRLAAQSPVSGTVKDRALDALTTLDFVGVVEEFPLSTALLNAWLTPYFPGLSFTNKRHNATAPENQTAAQDLAEIEETLGPSLYEKLLAENEADLALFEAARSQLLARRPSIVL